MAWMVYDYPEPDLKWELEHFMDDADEDEEDEDQEDGEEYDDE